MEHYLDEFDKYTTVFSSGYKEGEAADWALEAQAWYPDAYEVWQRMFSNKWDKADIGEYMRVLCVKMGDSWRTRFEPRVRAFYFKAKHNLGYAQRYDQLAPSEQVEKEEAHARAAKWHAEKVPRLRKEAREIRVRSQSSYIFDEREIIRRMKAYGKDKEERDAREKQEWLDGLRELSKVLHDRQEHRMRKREFARQQAKARERRLLKTAARARALRASRKAHGDGIGIDAKKKKKPSDPGLDTSDEDWPARIPPVTR